MVYIRPAYDHRPPHGLFARSRDPGTPLTVQRNIDESFRALNGLRILAGAPAASLGRAMGLNSAMNNPRPRGMGAPEPLTKFSSVPVKLREETYVLPKCPGLLLPLLETVQVWGVSTLDGLALPNRWSLSYVTCRLDTFEAPASNATVEVVLGNPNTTVAVPSTNFVFVFNLLGGLVLARRTFSTIPNGEEIHFPKGMLSGQGEGGLREIQPHAKVWVRVLYNRLAYHFPAFETRITALVDERVGLS